MPDPAPDVTPPAIAGPLRPFARPISQFRLLDGNPRLGDVESVKRSLTRFGQRKPIVVKDDGTVEAGNTTLRAALELGWDEIAAVTFNDDEATAKAFALADNRTSELGAFDLAALAMMAGGVHAADPDLLNAASFSVEDLQAWDRRLNPAPPDEFPEYDEDIPVEYQCPKCGYVGSGNWAVKDPGSPVPVMEEAGA